MGEMKAPAGGHELVASGTRQEFFLPLTALLNAGDVLQEFHHPQKHQVKNKDPGLAKPLDVGLILNPHLWWLKAWMCGWMC